MKKFTVKRKTPIKKLRELGKMLRDARKAKGLELRDAAKALGISFGTIAKIERAEYPRPKIDWLLKMAEFYELEADKIVLLANKLPPDIYWSAIDNNKVIFPLIRNLEV